jgi:hypothetical protein
MGTAMATGVGEATGVADAVERVLASFDPALVSASDAMTLVKVFDRIERMGAAGKALAAGRVAQTELWRRKGHKSAAHWMAADTGVAVGDAVRVLQTADALLGCEATAEAFKAGRVSGRQAKVIAEAASVAPDVEAELLAAAERLSMRELQDKARRLVAAGSGESDAQRGARWHARRSVRTWVDGDGMGCGQWRLPPAAHARVLATIRNSRDRIFADARRQGLRDPGEAYDADALVAVCEQVTNERSVGAADHAGAGREGNAGVVLGDDGCARDTSDVSSQGRTARDVKIIVRVDHSALVRGEVAAGEVCEIAGIGPVDAATVREWVAGDAFKAAIVTDGVDIRSVVHLGRRPIELQRTALEWHTAGSCAIEGCTSAARIEIDHVADSADTKHTTLDELAPVCGHHHDLKTHQGYRFGHLGANGKRPLIPPDATQGESFDSG